MAFDNGKRFIRNPYIIIIGNSDYPSKPLPAVKKDVELMKNLWLNKYKYKDVVSKENVKKIELKEYLIEQTWIIRQSKKNDGLIFIYSGHGTNFNNKNLDNNFIVTIDNERIPLTEIQEIFYGNCKQQLIDKPKIFYIDCCRGGMSINYIDNKNNVKGNSFNYTNYYNKFSDIYTHYATVNNHVSYALVHGSYLINAINLCYNEQFNYHDISLHSSELKINAIVTKSSKGKQTAESSSTLRYNVFIIPNQNQNQNIIPMTNNHQMDYMDIDIQQQQMIMNNIQQQMNQISNDNIKWLKCGKNMTIFKNILNYKLGYWYRNYNTAYSSQIVVAGKNKWTLKILNNNGCHILVGISSTTNHANTRFCGKGNQYDPYNFAYYNGGFKYSQYGNDIKYGVSNIVNMVSGDVVSIILDLSVGSISFTVNDVNNGIAFNNINKQIKYTLAVCLYGGEAAIELQSYKHY